MLPFLHHGRLSGRVDLKADRASGNLLVLGAYAEEHADRESLAAALATELRAMARWLGLDDVSVSKRGNVARMLVSALRT